MSIQYKCFCFYILIVLSDEENRESFLSTSQYSDDDSISPFSTDSEEERHYSNSLEQKKLSLLKFTRVKRKYSESNPESKELMFERSLKSRKIVRIGDAWFSHPMYDNRSSPEDSSSDDERNMINKKISYKAWDKKRKILKFKLSNYNKVSSSSSSSSLTLKTEESEISTSQQNHCESPSIILDETSEESEQFDELYQEKEAIEIDSNPSCNTVKTSDEESDQIDELRQEIEDNDSNQLKKDFF
jgi:hypothetical protein